MDILKLIKTAIAEIAANAWWYKLTPAAQQRYLEKYKRSKYAQEMRDRQEHMSWGDDDVEHHDPESEPIEPKHEPEVINKGKPELSWQLNTVEHNDEDKSPDIDLTSYDDLPQSVVEKMKYPEIRGRPASSDITLANRKAMLKHSGSFNSGHEATIKDYKSSSRHFNKPLRTKTAPPSPSMNTSIERMKHVTSNVMPEPQTLFRGNRMAKAMSEGHRFTDHGFTGTSLLPRIASSNFGGAKGHTFVIHTPAGTKGYYLDSHHNGLDHEQELLLHPETHYEVIGHTRHQIDDYSPTVSHVTHLAVVGQGVDAKGKPDYSLSGTPEFKKWKADRIASLGSWFKELTQKQQKDYLSDHPGKVPDAIKLKHGQQPSSKPGATAPGWLLKDDEEPEAKVPKGAKKVTKKFDPLGIHKPPPPKPPKPVKPPDWLLKDMDDDYSDNRPPSSKPPAPVMEKPDKKLDEPAVKPSKSGPAVEPEPTKELSPDWLTEDEDEGYYDDDTPPAKHAPKTVSKPAVKVTQKPAPKAKAPVGKSDPKALQALFHKLIATPETKARWKKIQALKAIKKPTANEAKLLAKLNTERLAVRKAAMEKAKQMLAKGKS